MDVCAEPRLAGLAFAFAAVQIPDVCRIWLAGAPTYANTWSRPFVAAPLTAAVGAGMAMIAPATVGPRRIAARLHCSSLSAPRSARRSGTRAAAPRPRTAQSKEAYRTRRRRREAAPRGRVEATSRRDSRTRLRSPGTRYRCKMKPKHFKLIGTTGTGKSTAIQEILELRARPRRSRRHRGSRRQAICSDSTIRRAATSCSIPSSRVR